MMPSSSSSDDRSPQGSRISSEVPTTGGTALEHNHVGSDEWIGARQFEITDVAGGCLMCSASAILSCLLLIINGAIVMALLSVAAASGAAWIMNEKLSQFLLFALPIALLIFQWWMIDTLRWILRRRGK